LKNGGFKKEAQRIRKALKEARWRVFRLFFWRTLLRILILALVACLALITVEKNFYLPAAWRIALLAAAFCLLAAVLLYGLWRAVRDYGSLYNVARAIDCRFPHFKNRLETALEFSSAGVEEQLYSQELARAAVEQAAGLVKDSSTVRSLVTQVLEGFQKKVRLEEYFFSGLAALFLLYLIADPFGFYRIYQNYTHPFYLLQQERDFRIFVRPGNKTILRGDSLRIKGIGSIYRPEEMMIQYWQAGEGKQIHSMPYQPDQFEYCYSFQNIENDIDYYLQQGKTLTDTFRIQVTNNPFITELHLRYEYPAYTGLPPYETFRDKSIRALRGTRLIISGRSSNPLKSAELLLGAGSPRQMKLDAERNFTDTLTLERDGGYRIRLEDCWGLTNTDTLIYPITVIPDGQPVIVLKFPGDKAQMDESMKQPLVFEAADDFGISRVELVFRKEKSTGQSTARQKRTLALYRKPETHILAQYLWDLKELSLLPQDEVVYSLAVFDNDRVTGPKSASTGEYRIRFPSIEEIFEQEQEHQQEIAQELEQLEEKGQKIRDQVKEMSEAIERGQKMEEGRRLDAAIKQQMEMVEQVKKLANQLQQSITQLEKGETVSTEIIQKLAQVQQLMQEVTTAQLKEVLDKLQQAINKLDKKAITEAMDQFRFSQEELLKKLDKTLTLLQKIKLEQQLDYLVSKTGELAQETRSLTDTTAALLGEPQGMSADSAAGLYESSAQEDKASKEYRGDSLAGPGDENRSLPPGVQGKQDLEKSTSGRSGKEKSQTAKGELQQKSQPEETASQSLDYLADELEKIGEKTAELFNKLAETSQDMERIGEKPMAEKLSAEGSRENLELLENHLFEINGNLNLGRLREAINPERRLSESMKQMHQRMKDYRDELEEKWKNKVAEAMARAFDELGFLSEHQEEIYESVKVEADINHPDILGYADQQQEIVEGLQSVSESLAAASRDNFFISVLLLAYLDTAIKRGQQSLTELEAESRNKDTALNELQSSLATINAVMLVLLQDRQNMQQSSSGMGLDNMMAQLEELTRRQEKLNQQMSESMGQQNPAGYPLTAPSAMPSPGQGDLMEMLRQMAAEQQAIRDQIAELADQMSGRKELPGSSMEGMTKEADEVIKDLLERGVSQETFNRQRRILDRLLDAQRSIQQKDTGRKRKSERPGEYTVTPPADLNRELLERSQEESQLKAILERWKGSYPESFETLIRDYFELLRSKNIEN